RENISQEDVANLAAFLASPLAARISGQILYVDAGFSAVGMLNNEMLRNVFEAFKSHLDG
ncbi:MAG: SDR family oxidoreductase, partial [Deltaproteobacteria bacterium]